MKAFNTAAPLSRLGTGRSGRLTRDVADFGRTAEQVPLNIRPQLFARHARGSLNSRAAHSWYLAPAGYPLTDRRRTYAQQASKRANATDRSTGFQDWFLFHGRECKALPNASQEALPNSLFNESN